MGRKIVGGVMIALPVVGTIIWLCSLSWLFMVFLLGCICLAIWYTIAFALVEKDKGGNDE